MGEGKKRGKFGKIYSSAIRWDKEYMSFLLHF
jgi:hypothetical protein